MTMPESDLDLVKPLAPTREEMLEAIPLHVVIDDTVDLDADDPALYVADTGRSRRLCVSTRRAGGRCTANAAADSLLCTVHSGRLDPSEGGKAKARKTRETSESEEERTRVGRLGTRALIAETLAQNGLKLQRTVTLLLTAASEGDLQAAKLVLPYINQGLGMPTERVETTAQEATSQDISGMSSEALAEMLSQRRAAVREPLN